ncbi:type II secretion system F family protein [Candidatus Daviesbacteria bacterium]|nr:type II secretion system F family protein [Candidatus Daviesbacteria bacterium]
MAEYRYTTKDLQGVEHTGEIQAGDIRSASAILRKKSLVVISITPKTPTAGQFIDKYLNRVSFDELVIMTRQLATMVGAGLVLSEAIDILEEQQDKKALKKALKEISQNIKGGLTLALALNKYPDIFPRLYVNLIKSGEASGKLDKVLLQMADDLEKNREFRARIQGALIYPAVVVTMMFGVIIVMMVFVIPRLTSLYAQSSIELPLPTQILIGISNIFTNFWWLLLLLCIGGYITIKRWIATPKGGYLFDSLILKLPIVGKVVTSVTLTNFNRTFGLLVSAGIPLLESISIVEDQTGNLVFRNSLKEAYLGVEKGLPFSSLLSGKVFPKIVSQMVRVGEETGKVDEIFFKLADYFESESDHMIKNLTVAIEPIVLVILGGGVIFLLIAIMLPIFKLTTSF